MRVASWSVLAVLGGLLAGCGGETGLEDGAVEEVASVTQAVDSVTITGPTTITSTRQSYAANTSLIEPSFTWYVRNCPTSSVSACTAGWIYSGTQSPGTGQRGTYTTSLVPDCTGGGTKSFQLKVTAKGWLSATVEDTHVTMLCAPELP